MIIIVININVLLFIGLLLVSFSLGYLIRSSYIRSYRERIIELEKEMLNNHARILELEKEKAATAAQIKESKSRLMPIKSQKENEVRRNRDE
jgi:sensor histidine kinase YesM